MTVTPLYGGLLGIWFLALTVRVIMGRTGPDSPSLGDGGNPAMLRKIRGHANFAEYVPLTLLLIALLELTGSPKWALHLLGAALLTGRLLHGYALAFTQEHAFGRSAGIGLTLLSLTGAALMCILAAVHPA